jgi:hypothetical protein
MYRASSQTKKLKKMSVIVLIEHTGGTIKKKNFEALQYAAQIAKKWGPR